MSDSLRPHGLQHTRLPCPSPTPRACSDSCSSSRGCHATISSSVIPFSSYLQSFPTSGSFPKGDPSFGSYQASLRAQLVKNPPVMWETWVLSLGWEYLLENGKATHPSILAWRIPWTAHGVTKSQTQLSNFAFHFLRSWSWVVLWRNFISTLSISFFSAILDFFHVVSSFLGFISF